MSTNISTLVSNPKYINPQRNRSVRPPIHNADIRILQLYKRSHLPEVVPQMFEENSTITDEVLHEDAHGIPEIHRYFDKIYESYKDVFLTDIDYSYDDEENNKEAIAIETKWTRVQQDDRFVYGTDHLVLNENNKFKEIRSHVLA